MAVVVMTCVTGFPHLLSIQDVIATPAPDRYIPATGKAWADSLLRMAHRLDLHRRVCPRWCTNFTAGLCSPIR